MNKLMYVHILIHLTMFALFLQLCQIEKNSHDQIHINALLEYIFLPPPPVPISSLRKTDSKRQHITADQGNTFIFIIKRTFSFLKGRIKNSFSPQIINSSAYFTTSRLSVWKAKFTKYILFLQLI